MKWDELQVHPDRVVLGGQDVSKVVADGGALHDTLQQYKVAHDSQRELWINPQLRLCMWVHWDEQVLILHEVREGQSLLWHEAEPGPFGIEPAPEWDLVSRTSIPDRRQFREQVQELRENGYITFRELEERMGDQ